MEKNYLEKKRYCQGLLLMIVMALCSISSTLLAQDALRVTGKVTGIKGEPLPGVSVIVKGTTTGVITDSEGKYSILIKNKSGSLLFKYVGYTSQEIAINGQSVINASLTEDSKGLNEVVVIGYGSRKKKDITGSISAITAKDIENTPYASPEFALQGKVSGVRIVNSSGDPTAAPNIYVRGIGTWNGAAQPLYVIDGQIITPPTAGNSDLIGTINLWTLVNPNDIESISVLKDASSAAIYGSRGANGVILITTRRGKKGAPVLEFNGTVGTQNVPTYKMLNSQQLIDLTREMYMNNSSPDININKDLYGRNQTDLPTLLNNYSPQLDPTSPYYLGANPENYNWQNELVHKNAISQNYDVKVSGASDASNYYVSAGYTNQQSVLRGNDLERFTLTSNVNTSIGKYIRAGINYRLTKQTDQNNSTVNLEDAAGYLPWQPIHDPNNPTAYAMPVTPYFGGTAWNPVKLYGIGTKDNFFAIRNENVVDFNLLRNMGQGFLEFEPIKGLVFRAQLSADYTYQERKNFQNVLSEEYKVNGQDPASFGNGSSFGDYGLRTNKFLNYQADYTVSYNKTFGLHSLNLLASVQDQYHTQYNEDLETTNTDTNDPKKIGINNEVGYVSGFAGTNQEKYWFGYVARASYNYASTYYLDASFRRDASNGFAPDKRFGNFYSASGAYRISTLDFIKNLKFINDLKIRGGWGQAGNDEAVVGNYAFLSNKSDQGTYGLGSGNGVPNGLYNLGVTFPAFPNRDIRWETVATSYVGLEATMFGNKLSVNLEFWKRLTSNILQYVNLPYSVGTDNPAFNIGTLRNTGIDLEASYNNKIGDFNYAIGGNISFVHNKVLSLYNHEPLYTSYGYVQEGQPIGIIWGYKVGGIFKNQAQIDQYFAKYTDANVTDKTLVKPGDMYFQDVHGDPTAKEPFYSKTPDGKIDSYDQTNLGSTIPGYTYGINATLGYKAFDVTLNFYGEGDVVKVNTFKENFTNMAGPGGNESIAVLNRWTPQNPNATLPRAVYGDPAGNNRYSDRWVESGAFFRLNSWQLGYSLPGKLLQNTHVFSKLRIFVGGQNNFTITRYSGIDPVNDQYPLPKMINVGVNARF